ncbi:MAG: Nucleotide-binding protein [uncultured bacterium]|nr:MAG: Nucleotide-binding protein [uncultured bacterium]
MKEYITKSSLQTKKLGQEIAKGFKGGEIICLSGDLGAGKTTFTQGLLKGLTIKGPYTSPTFAILKEYKLKSNNISIENIYHIDAYRISARDLLELGFKDFAGKKNSITILEWPENVKSILPNNSIWMSFKWLNNKERKIITTGIKSKISLEIQKES